MSSRRRRSTGWRRRRDRALTLSVAREVCDRLKADGGSETVFKAIGRGHGVEAAGNSTAVGRKKNRRVVVTIRR